MGVILYECLIGSPPFYGDDPVTTCRKILHWKQTLKWPQDRVKHLSPECLDFVKSLMTDADKRLGRNGFQEVKNHPWLRGVDFDHLLDRDGAYVPPHSKVLGSLLERLSKLPRDHPEFEPMLKQLTSQFDDFSNLPADDPRNAAAGGGAGDGRGTSSAPGARPLGSRVRNRFVGYTFKRAPDSKLSAGGAGSSSAAPVAGSAVQRPV